MAAWRSSAARWSTAWSSPTSRHRLRPGDRHRRRSRRAWQPDLLDGVAVVRGSGYEIDRTAWEGRLYRPLRRRRTHEAGPVPLTAIPVYAWANRGPNAMKVWIPRA